MLIINNVPSPLAVSTLITIIINLITPSSGLAQNLFDRRRHHNFSSSFRSNLFNQDQRQLHHNHDNNQRINHHRNSNINSASNLNPVHGLAPISVHDHPFLNQSMVPPPTIIPTMMTVSMDSTPTYRDGNHNLNSQPMNRRPMYQSRAAESRMGSSDSGQSSAREPQVASESNLSPSNISPSVPSKKIVCYYTNWSQYRPSTGRYVPENIDPFLCTHIIFAFGWMKNNKVSSFDAMDESKNGKKGLYDRITELKLINPKLKVNNII